MKEHRLGWFGKHKVLTGLLIGLLLIVGVGLYVRSRIAKKASANVSSYSFVRTTTLTKTSLDDSVSVTGTVQASDTANVTVSENVKTYKVETINVKVGDTVKAGDVIATLDTTDALAAIEKAQKTYNENVQSAQTSLTRAQESYNVAVVQHQNKLIDLQTSIDDADKAQTKAEDTLNDAKKKYNNLESAYNDAKDEISSYTDAYDEAVKMGNLALTAYNASVTYESNPSDTDAYNDFKNAADAYINAISSSQGIIRRVTAFSDISYDTTVSVSSSQTDWKAAYSTAQGYTDRIDQALTTLENTCSGSDGTDTYYGFNSLEMAYTSAKSTKEQAQTSYDNAVKQVKSAHDNYDNEKNSTTLTNSYQQVEDAQTKLKQAKENTNDLETQNKLLTNCTLTATMSGTVTAVNAVVGSTCNESAAATIQNVDGLKVNVTIPAASISGITTGMSCNITTDTTDNTVSGTLTQIDPVANSSGSFGATVTVNGDNTGLLVGVSAKVEIVKSSTDGVFVVPMDAVGTADDGSSYVLRQTGGSGVDMTFEEVPVTVGNENDYYCEISGDTLAEGDVIRSSADLTEGIVTSDDASDPASDWGIEYEDDSMPAGGGDMPQGGGGMPAGGGGGMPSGGGAPGGM